MPSKKHLLANISAPLKVPIEICKCFTGLKFCSDLERNFCLLEYDQRYRSREDNLVTLYMISKDRFAFPLGFCSVGRKPRAGVAGGDQDPVEQREAGKTSRLGPEAWLLYATDLCCLGTVR